MLEKIKNQPRDYAWGSHTLLADLGYHQEGPKAEVWFGTHPISEAVVVSTGQPLSTAISHRLDFMIKFLAADSPLSIQVHPEETRAAEGFKTENAAGIELWDSARNFKDASAKREAIVALSQFDLLAGFKRAETITRIFEHLAERLTAGAADLAANLAERIAVDGGILDACNTLLRGQSQSNDEIELLKQLRVVGKDLNAEIIDIELLENLFNCFGLDRGILLAMMMKRFTLRPGEAVYVEAGVPHCYLSGLGVEILNSSDNVLRGGLTSKNVSPEDFLANLNLPVSMTLELQKPEKISNGLWRYGFDTTDFQLHRIEVSGQNLLVDFKIPGESILVCTSGRLDISNSLGESVTVTGGEAAYLSADANFFSIAGSGGGLLASR